MRSVLLLVGTKRGLFTLRSDAARTKWSISGPQLAGREIFHCSLDTRHPGTLWAASNHKIWGAHVHRSTDDGASWDVLPAAPGTTGVGSAPAHAASASDAAAPRDAQTGRRAIWCVEPGPATAPGTLFAGVEPAALFVSRDLGESWQPVTALNEHPTRSTWQPAGGGLALAAVRLDPADTERLYAAISAGGVYRSDDGGRSWKPVNRGTRTDFQPERQPESGQCVHQIRLHPERPERLYQQGHCGTYRSDDAGESWTEVTEGLPSDFGYALAIDPNDAATVFVVPQTSSHMRAAVDGRLRVYRSTDAGASWHAMTDGLPQRHAYVSVLREAMHTDALDPCGVYMGTSSGHLFASHDRGESWHTVAEYLPRILCVYASVVDS